MTTRADIVFSFGFEMYDDALRREFCHPADQTVLALAADERVGHLVVADAYRSYVLSAARRRPLKLVEDIAIGGRPATRARPYRLRKDDSTDSGTVERAYQRYGELLGQALAHARGEQEPKPESATLVTYQPFAAAFCNAPWINRVVYLGSDDWATGEGTVSHWDVYKESYRRMEDRRATMFGVSAELAGRLSPRAEVVPNGVIAGVWQPQHPAPPRIAELPGPRAIYTGSIGDRLDRELVETTASMVGSLIFMGHFGDAATMEWLRATPNVHLFGPVGQRELAATVQACDVGVIPHRDQECIRAMSPIKLYEYLAAGIPTVTVDLPPVHGIDDERVLICRREEWAAGMSRALGMDRADEQRRLRFIDEVSWQSRLGKVVDAAVG